MHRFKPSKYKNATPKVPKRGEGWVLDLTVGSPQSFGNHIKSSAAFMAFNIDSGGGSGLGVLPLNDHGRMRGSLPTLHAHAGLVTDFDFSPFDDAILATASEDCHVKVWRIPCDGLSTSVPCNPEIMLDPFDHRVEVVLFHPTVDCLLTMSVDKTVRIWDISKNTEIYANTDHDNLVQSLHWKGDGSLLVSSARDKKLRILDPRTKVVTQETKSHSNNRDSRVLWLGNSDQVLSTGFGSAREREVMLRDVRNFSNPVASYSGESSLGVLIPLFDPDTNMLFLTAKADTCLMFWEINNKEPYFNEGIRYVGDVQTKGAALVPKRALEVMQAEVNRVLLLGPDCVVPVSFQVPRKSYRDYHEELFPDTAGTEPSLTLDEWMMGSNDMVSKISLNPRKWPNNGLLKFNHVLGSGPTKTILSKMDEDLESQDPEFIEKKEKSSKTSLQKPSVLKKPLLAPKPALLPSSLNGAQNLVTNISSNIHFNAEKAQMNNNNNQISREPHQNQMTTGQPQNEISTEPNQHERPRPGRKFAVRVSKFRHLNGTIHPKETHITNLTNMSKSIPGESNGFDANIERVAVPLGGCGGNIAVFELANRGRLQAGLIPSLMCGSGLMDFSWDPFDHHRLVTGCEDGHVQIWTIPDGGVQESMSEPAEHFQAHSEKIYSVHFNPCAKDVLVTASQDLSVKIWDLVTKEEKIKLEGHQDQIFSLAWSPDGCLLATVAKDKKIRIYDPRNSSLPIREGPGPEGSRGARVVWTLGGSHLVMSGFSKISERQISVYDSTDLSSPLTTEGIDVSPAILIPFYDENSSSLFLSGRGDSTVFVFEVSASSPYLYPLSHYKCPGPHQAIVYFPKCVCNIADVEFARALRLTKTSIEPLSFTVPRLRSEYFQDDLFPDVRVTWEPTVSSHMWFDKKNGEQKWISLKPEGMTPLSEAVESKPPKLTHTEEEPMLVFEGELILEGSLAFMQGGKEKEERIVSAMKEKMNFEDNALPQDNFEGVDPEEWEEDK
ncbi:coronin-7-like [Limulus polyphemus]|uniref:Coronin n=1 Tax=Limulus polyphemus TaxID=6850 RepID=A0ABM1AZV8_LIMPO|nr:coronin-7-like [Limulus polyphemus]